MKAITSFSNPRVKRLTGLRQRAQRRETGCTLIDGRREIRRAAAAGMELTELYHALDDIPEDERLDFIKLSEEMSSKGGEVWAVRSDILRKAAFGDRYEGVLAVARTPDRKLDDLKLGKFPFVIVVEKVEKPGNLGAILRIADAAGAEAVIAADAATDIYNPNVIRASTGTVFHLPTVAAGALDVFDFLRTRKIRIVAAVPSAEHLYTGVDFQQATALILGSERDGLSEAWLEAADDAVSLPMKGMADSLNVATTAAVLAYEVLRQRGGKR